MGAVRKILITGSSGFCGRFLAGHFARMGTDVVGLDLKTLGAAGEKVDLKFIRCDVRDRHALKRIFREEKPSHVIHLAYILEPQHDKQLEYEVDVKGSKNVLEAANETSSVKQFILMSSISVYGAHPDNPEWIMESHGLRPNDYAYAAHKKEVEEHYRRFDMREDMKLVVLRMCVAVGPDYDKLGGVVSNVANAPFLLSILGGDGRVQFIHEEDVIELFDRLVHDEAVEGTFNLSPDSFTTAGELGKELKKVMIPFPLFLLERIFGLLWRLRLAPMPPAIARLMAHGIVVSPDKLKERYDYAFKYSSKKAFMEVIKKRRRQGTL